ncbi:hypothetical protein PPYR_02283 [Photinus pyralis]|uniref:Uncharacterized protein n=1 Tax=Photinus pyralis TaxID=7054 RepID=A0A5N4B6Z1_PHOPY|nr:hypothetical protein PPYR_02283 [Photinus pyralis]
MAATESVGLRVAVNQCIIVLCDEIIDLIRREQNKKRRMWVRKWIARRSTHGFSSMLLKELSEEGLGEYRNCMRMSKEAFDILLAKISPFITTCDTIMRDAIPAKIKLEITLTYLATGNSFRTLQRSLYYDLCLVLQIDVKKMMLMVGIHACLNMKAMVMLSAL